MTWFLYRLRFGKLNAALTVALLGSLLDIPQVLAGTEARSFEVTGTLKNISSAGKVMAHHNFDVYVEGCKWIIHTDFEPSSGIGYIEDSCDGNTVYSYIQFINLPSSVTSTSAGIIELNDVPYEKSKFATSVWLAFGSSCYFKEVKHNHVKLFFDLGDTSLRLNSYTVKVDWDGSKLPPFVPNYVDFYDDGLAHSGKNGKSLSISRQPPYDKGYTSRKFLVTAFTNINGMAIPAAFQMQSLVPKPDGTNANDLGLVFTQEGSIDSIKINPEPKSIVPHLDAACYIEDRRFAAAKPPVQQIFYYNNSKSWLPTSSSSVVDVYRRDLQISGMYSEPVAPNMARILVWALLLLPVIFTLGFAFKKLRSRGN